MLLVGGCADLPWLTTTAPVVDAEPMSVSPPASDVVVEPTASPTDEHADDGDTADGR